MPASRVPLASSFAVLFTLACASCAPPPTSTSDFAAFSFPDDFAFGTAVAQWQVEGDRGVHGPVDSNWRRWAQMGKTRFGQSNDDGNGFFTQFAADAQRAKDLGLDTFRLGVDWSRIEPQPGVFDDDELQHFVDELDAIAAAGLKPVVTLYHWTVPVWVQQPDPDAPGGAVDRLASRDTSVVDDFDAFVRHVLPAIKGRVDTYTVLNEPFSMISVGYLDGRFPPGKRLDIDAATRFGLQMLRMHAVAYRAIKELDDVDADGDGAPSFVGITMTANDFVPEIADAEGQKRAVQSINYVFNDWMMKALVQGDLDVNLDGDTSDTDTDPVEGHEDSLAGTLEFVGVQYYGPGKVTDEGLLGGLLSQTAPLFGAPLLDVATYTSPDDQALPHNGMGREISAAGFRTTLQRYAQWGIPIIVTENGTTTNTRPDDSDPSTPPTLQFDDDQAAFYLLEHLWELGRAVHDGVDVRGYYHWTLVDNFEWVDGRTQRFGAYRVDFDDPTYPRTLTKMGEALRDVVQARAVNATIWNRYALARYGSDARAQPRGTTSADPATLLQATR